MNDRDFPDDHTNNHDATADEPSRNLLPKLMVAPVAILILVTMIGLPLLTILNDRNDSTTGDTATGDAGARTALIFASAMLESRSNEIARRYAEPDTHPRIDQIARGLQRLTDDEVSGATARTTRVPCELLITDHDCFVSQLARDGDPPIAEIRFIIGPVNGSPRVIAVNRRAKRQAGLR